MIELSAEVEHTLKEGAPVVALETTLVAANAGLAAEVAAAPAA